MHVDAMDDVKVNKEARQGASNVMRRQEHVVQGRSDKQITLPPLEGDVLIVLESNKALWGTVK